MTPRSHFRCLGLLALSAALAAPAVHAQTAEPKTDAAQSAMSQPASPQTEAVPAKKTWAELDVDKNGNLDKAEAAGAPSLQAVFDKVDANADGMLTGDEYKTYLAANGHDAGAPPAEAKKK